MKNKPEFVEAYRKIGDPGGDDFEEAWPRRVEVDLMGFRIPFISRADLILSKKAAGRPRDLLDAEDLEKTAPDE